MQNLTVSARSFKSNLEAKMMAIFQKVEDQERNPCRSLTVSYLSYGDVDRS